MDRLEGAAFRISRCSTLWLVEYLFASSTRFPDRLNNAVAPILSLYIVREKIGNCNRMSCDGKLDRCDFETGQNTFKTYVEYSR